MAKTPDECRQALCDLCEERTTYRSREEDAVLNALAVGLTQDDVAALLGRRRNHIYRVKTRLRGGQPT